MSQKPGFEFDQADAQKLLAQLASALAHDVRTPIRHAGQFLDIYESERDSQPNGVAQEHLDTAKVSIDLVAEMVEGLIGYIRVGRGLSQPEPVELKKLTETALSRVKFALDVEAADFEFSGDSKVLGHPVRLMELFSNLFENAIQFAKRDQIPTIRIYSTRTDDWLELEISDQGRGIRDEQVEMAFGLFHSLENSDTGLKGLGIGLPLSQRIAELHGGSLPVIPEGDDRRGLKLLLRLPACD